MGNWARIRAWLSKGPLFAASVSVIWRLLHVAWTDPVDYVPDQVVTDTDMNAMQNNLRYTGKGRPKVVQKVDNGADYTTTSTTFGDVHATNLAASITTNGGAVLVAFFGVANGNTSAQKTYFDVSVDGTRWDSGATDGITVVMQASGAPPLPTGFVVLITGLAAGAHTFKLQWKTSTGTATLYGGSGAAGSDLIPVFWVEELG